MTTRHLFRAALVLGIGLGAFIDGIVLHQILGWHHLVCTTETCRPDSVAALELQNTQDGFFHLGALLLTLGGLIGVWRAHRKVVAIGLGGAVLGGCIAGWGVFNFVEGLIDHQILGIHHVKPDSPHWLLYDMLFLASGPVLFAAGYFLARWRGAERPDAASGA